MADATELEQATGRTMADLATAAGERFGNRTAVRFKGEGEWRETSYADAATFVDELAGGLAELGFEAGDRACILADTRPEWVYASFAISSTGGIVVPIYPTNSPRECQWVAGNSEAKVVFVENADQAAKIEQIRGELPELEHLVIFDGSADGAISLDELRERGRTSDHADELAKRHDAVSEAEPDETFNRFEEKLYKNVRAAFGGKIRQAVTGAAPIAPDILEFFHACGVTVLEGWGLTETTGIGCVNTPDAFKFGTVGRPAPGVDVKTGDEGELLMKGPNVFKEYWRNDEATRETFTDDGWFRTGDVGEIDDEGFVKITGRMKDIIITAGGKNLTPANIENELKQSRWISQAVMHGDRRPFPVALITLDEEEIIPWAKEQGLPTDVAELAENDKIRDLVQGCLDEVNSNHAQVAQIKKFKILDHDLSQETGELTPTLKVKRNVVNDKYAGLVDTLYSK